MTQKYLRHAIKESVHYASTPTLYYDHQRAAQVQKYSSTLYLSSSDNSDLSSENNDLVLSQADLRKAETSLKGEQLFDTIFVFINDTLTFSNFPTIVLYLLK